MRVQQHKAELARVIREHIADYTDAIQASLKAIQELEAENTRSNIGAIIGEKELLHIADCKRSALRSLKGDLQKAGLL